MSETIQEQICPVCNGHGFPIIPSGYGNTWKIPERCAKCDGVGVLNPKPDYVYKNMYGGGSRNGIRQMLTEGYELVEDRGSDVILRRRAQDREVAGS